MKIAKYGLDNFLILCFLGLVVLFFSFFFFGFYIKYLLSLIGILIIAYAFWFFRDPERKVPILALEDQSLVVAPADGKVIEIKRTNTIKVLDAPGIQISIFLSPLDIHVNRIPISGKVVHFEYNPGKYFVAFHPKASEENEHTFIVIENTFGKVAFKQIAGILARRVVCTLAKGNNVNIGERFGMIKFGSRMDVILPKSSEILIELNQKVVAGETIIARLPRDVIWEKFPLEHDND
ncbi:MAG: phosphatidylserine decarboxylase family protein [Candidatus Kapaibacteriales bacterium]